MTNLIVTRKNIETLEMSPVWNTGEHFDDYPFPYDDVARVIASVDWRQKGKIIGQMPVYVVIMPSGVEGEIHVKEISAKWESAGKAEDGQYQFLISQINGTPLDKWKVDWAAGIIHGAIMALKCISAYNLPSIEAQKRDVRRATKGMSRQPETKTDKYYVLKLSGRSLDYLPEPQEKCRAGVKHRWHMCRGHYRHLRSGKVVFVKGHYRGDKALGIVHKDYAL